MLSLHPGQELDRIAARLAGTGALALLLIDAEPLERIERRYGTQAHQVALDGLLSLVRELAREVVPSEDVLLTQERHSDAILAFLFRPRSDLGFYTSRLHELTGRISNELIRQGKHIVYPYHRDPLVLAVGVAVVLHNPSVKAERQILQAVTDARRDAALEAGLQARRGGQQLLQVILSGDVSVRFEPIADLNSAQILGYEALVRGPRSTDIHSPQQLFRLAGQVGLLFEVDCLCRRVALERSAILPRDKLLFLNCLPTAIGDPNLHDEGLRKTLEDFHLRPSDLVLEISENESIDNFAIFREMRNSCQDLGIRVAIDDAGTGYASLEAIMEIAPDFIKSDMSLVRGIDSDPSRQEVVRALSAVAQGIGAKVIAEGIETDGELRTLRELGVPYGQGYYFGQALPGGCGTGSTS